MFPLPPSDDPALAEPVDLAIFGGSGFYSFVEGLTPIPLDTPYGPPSSVPMVGSVDGRRVAFIARHGIHHTIPAHRVNYRANVWAFARLGARAVISPFACGALRPDLGVGDLVVVDQLVDRTSRREGTFFDGPETVHLTFADPYDPTMGRELTDAADGLGLRVHRGGTVVVIDGPRFSTRAESRWHAAQGWDLVNMTQAPEVALVREAAMASLGVGIITDHDAGLEGEPDVAPVTGEQVLATLRHNAEVLKSLLRTTIGSLTLPDSVGAQDQSWEA
ncbi:MAG: MTAP family purine nucleoside phosphorylase [Microthrixaceae bacterium]|nr:MTAP family purine nucleoside phosphorylase [Microthrixaceae bacterium]